MSQPVPSASYDTVGAARYLNCSPGYLKTLRKVGGGPTFTRLFKRKGIIYEQTDLDSFKANRRFGSTTEYPEDGG